jgi:MFS family permease
MAVGSVAGALFAAGRARPTRGLLLAAVGLLGAASLAGAAAPTLAWELLVLPVIGAAVIVFLSSSNATLQLAAAPRLRGRVMALHGMIFLGATPFGSLIAAWLADAFGPRAPRVTGAAACLLAAGTGAVLLRRARAADATEPVVEEARERSAA